MAKKRFGTKVNSRMVSKKLAVAKKKIVDAGKKIKMFVKNNPKKSVLAAATLAAAVGAAVVIAVKKLNKK